MDDQVIANPTYSIDVVMFDSKKKKSPNMQTEEKEYEENKKGKKMKIVFDGVKLVYNKSTLLVEDMIAVASSKSKEIVIHSLPRIAEGYRERYWKKSKIQFSSKEQATEWFTILHNAIENSRYTTQSERGPFMEFPDNSRAKRVRVILNPHGGKGDAQHVFNTRLLPILQIAGIQCDIEITKYSANAKDLAITHEPDKYEGVLLVSGDGLVNEFVNGLMQRVDCCYAIYNTPICHVSAGTQNQIAGGIGTTCFETAAYCIIKHRIKGLDILKVSPKNQPVQYSLCGVVSGIGGDMVKDYEDYRVYGCLRYPLLKVKWGVIKRQKHVTDLIYTPINSKIGDYQKKPCRLNHVNCPVCRDGHYNYFMKPIKCPNQHQEAIQPELSSEDSDIEIDNSTMISNTCGCEFPRWGKVVGNRDYIDDDIYEITADVQKACCKPDKIISRDYPERIPLDIKEVEERDIQYLTIGIVVNAPYDGEFSHCCDGSLDILIARSGTCCQTTGLVGRYITKTHLQSPLMDYIKAKKVILRYPGENTVNVDGEELTYNDELVVEVCEAGVSCYGELYNVC